MGRAPARRNLEARYLAPFTEALDLACHGEIPVHRGQVATNRFDPGFNLAANQWLQFGDLRADLADRVVVVEVESAGGVTNLVKYWPLAQRSAKPIFLLHVFGQSSEGDYVAHLRLWDFLWERMRPDVAADSSSNLWAKRFTFLKGDLATLHVAVEAFKQCLIEPMERLLAVHGWRDIDE